jgi:hypothetical protein
MVFRYDGPGGARLYARRADDLVPRPLDGTEGAEQPFFSPDGASVGSTPRGSCAAWASAAGPRP